MKKNIPQSITYIEQAMRSLGSDFALTNARSYLSRAIAELSKVQKKRGKREDMRKHYDELALKKQEEWWNLIKENMKKSQLNNPEGLGNKET